MAWCGRVLTAKLGAPSAAEAARVEALADPARLEHLLVELAAAQDVEAARAALARAS